MYYFIKYIKIIHCTCSSSEIYINPSHSYHIFCLDHSFQRRVNMVLNYKFDKD